jgi:aspartate 1-decarboxylase
VIWIHLEEGVRSDTGMLREILRAKIQNAVVTGKELYYQGSIGIDKGILSKSGILANEKVQILNFDNGECFDTYVIEEKLDSRAIILYGPAARKAEIGDKISIISYALEEDSRARILKPKIILLDGANKIKL